MRRKGRPHLFLKIPQPTSCRLLGSCPHASRNSFFLVSPPPTAFLLSVTPPTAVALGEGGGGSLTLQVSPAWLLRALYLPTPPGQPLLTFVLSPVQLQHQVVQFLLLHHGETLWAEPRWRLDPKAEGPPFTHTALCLSRVPPHPCPAGFWDLELLQEQ